jgi:hypothetical protein
MIAYVAGPYREGHGRTVHANIDGAALVAMDLWKIGCTAICPHLNTAHFDGPVEQYLAGDLEILSKCDAIVMAPFWRESDGACAELRYARKLGLPAYEWYAIGHIRELTP